MNSSLPLYALGGAVSFCILSAIATKYRGEEIQTKHLLRDSTAGALFTAFILVLIPDMFPPLTVSGATLAAALSTIKLSGGSTTNTISNSDSISNNDNIIQTVDDFDLQVGYPKRK
jgi:hypothetical protein